MRKILSGAARVARGFCGALLVYIVACNAVADPLATNYPDRTACWPYHSIFGLLQTDCEDPVLWTFWFVAADIPRFLIVPPGLAIGQLKAAAHNLDYAINASRDNFGLHFAWGHFLEALPWIAMSIPIVLIGWIGFRYWRTRRPIVAWTLVLAFAAEVGWLGLRM